MGNILEVRRESGDVLLEVDEHGQSTKYLGGMLDWDDIDIVVDNRIRARIESAACGGATLDTLIGCRSGLCLGDVDDIVVADSVYRKGMAAVTVLMPAVMANQLRRNLARLGMDEGIEGRGDGLRMFLFVADQVIREGEPEPEEWPMFAAALTTQGVGETAFAFHPRVRTAIEDLVSGTVPTVAVVLPSLFGVKYLAQIPPKALWLWAVDNGVHDLLPDCYRNAMESDDE
ncbi:MAG: hypothetical protein H6948_02110 [Zoogloeaceae bacterium]|nr:hypothetical protein [Zoogloeaceae bacterium]